MPAMPAPVPGQPIWAELFVPDADAARSFWTALLDWDTTEPTEEFGGYTNFIHGGSWVAGLMANTIDPGLPAAWTVYLHTDDVHALVARAEAAGATVIVPPGQVAELGWFAQLVDPSGATVGAWQPGTHPGFTRLREPGAPYWFELHAASGYDAALDFYREVFGWRTSTMADSPEFRYTRLVGAGVEGEPEGPDDVRAGVLDSSPWPGSTSAWQVYWTVEELASSVARAEALGATVVDAPHETPFGRLATLRDPAGAPFKLAEPLG